MKASHDLFELIQSMSQGEKRYFKLFVKQQRGKDVGYLRLFDAIAKQTHYDEEKLLKKFRRETFAKHLHVAKNYLYNLILKCLENYNPHDHPYLTVLSFWKRYVVLRNKGLYKQCWKVLDKMTKIVNEYNMIDFQFTIYREKTYLTRQTLPKDMDIVAAKNLFKVNNNYIEEIKNCARVLHCGMIFTLAQARKDIKDVSLHDVADELLLMRADPKASNWIKMVCNELLGFYYSVVLKQSDKAMDCARANLHIFEEAPKLKAHQQFHYLVALVNITIAYRREKDLLKMETHVQAMEEQLFEKSTRVNENLWRFFIPMYYDNALILHANLRNYAKVDSLVEEFKDLLSKHERHLNANSIRLIYYNITGIYFMAQQYKKASFWCDAFADKFKNAFNRRCLIGIMDLVCHFEMGNHEILPYLTQSVSTYTERKRSLSTWERQVFSYFDQMSRVFPRERKGILEKIYDKLNDTPPPHKEAGELLRAWLTKYFE